MKSLDTYKAISLDLDGTSLDSNSKISDKLVQLLNEIRNKGIKIFFVTGRTKLEVDEVLPDYLDRDGLVTANGMVNYIDHEVISKHALNTELVEKVVFEARNDELYYEVHPQGFTRYALSEDQNYMKQELSLDKPASLKVNEYLARLENLDSLLNWENKLILEDVVKVYFFSMNQEKIRLFKEKLGNMQNHYPFDLFSSSAHSAEIMTSGVSKATGVKQLLNHYKLPSDQMLAVGDGGNDLPMFQVAGCAVAMQNADSKIKEHADEVTRYSNDEHGVYQYLKDKFADLL